MTAIRFLPLRGASLKRLSDNNVVEVCTFSGVTWKWQGTENKQLSLCCCCFVFVDDAVLCTHLSGHRTFSTIMKKRVVSKKDQDIGGREGGRY